MVALNFPFEQRRNLERFAEVVGDNIMRFLGFSLNLDTADLIDDLQSRAAEHEMLNPTMYRQIAEVLIEYSGATKKHVSGKLTKFHHFPGGVAYENAFNRKAVQPISKCFAKNPHAFIEASRFRRQTTQVWASIRRSPYLQPCAFNLHFVGG
jgi:hypothetical protein